MSIRLHLPSAGLALSLIVLTDLSPGQVASTVEVGGQDYAADNLPDGLVLREDLGLVCHETVKGQVVHVAPAEKNVYEPRTVLTPKGELLLMFPEGKHYSSGLGKLNAMLAYRSGDGGKSWQGPQVAFDIDYSQHGFIPLIPRGTTRIYAFGTQPISSEYTRERGQQENAPIGFRWSDDDGHTWSDVKLIRPEAVATGAPRRAADAVSPLRRKDADGLTSQSAQPRQVRGADCMDGRAEGPQ